MLHSLTKSKPAGLLLGLVSISCLTFALNAHSQGAAQSGSETPYSSSIESSGASTQSSTMSSTTLSNADEKILKELAQANITEISAGKMAEQKSGNDQVKSFAKTMVDDHTKALDELTDCSSQRRHSAYHARQQTASDGEEAFCIVCGAIRRTIHRSIWQPCSRRYLSSAKTHQNRGQGCKPQGLRQ